MLNFTLSGIDQARATIARVVAPVNDDRIGENAAVALEPVAEEARRLAPRDSGDLIDSIGIANSVADSGTDGKAVFVGVLRAGAGGSNSHVFYAHFIEFGTVTNRAHPFLIPAIFKHQELVMEVLGVRIGQDMIDAI